MFNAEYKEVVPTDQHNLTLQYPIGNRLQQHALLSVLTLHFIFKWTDSRKEKVLS